VSWLLAFLGKYTARGILIRQRDGVSVVHAEHHLNVQRAIRTLDTRISVIHRGAANSTILDEESGYSEVGRNESIFIFFLPTRVVGFLHDLTNARLHKQGLWSARNGHLGLPSICKGQKVIAQAATSKRNAMHRLL
jgi:hypothetical protein